MQKTKRLRQLNFLYLNGSDTAGVVEFIKDVQTVKVKNTKFLPTVASLPFSALTSHANTWTISSQHVFMKVR